MTSRTKAKIALSGAGALAIALSTTLPASADYEPNAHDIVGVGGDTPQFALQFLSDGSATGASGYNGAGNSYKLVTFNATADANARQAYTQGSTEATPSTLNPTDVLRAGQTPVQRVQSSGDGLTALVGDTGTPRSIDFVFSASLPSAAQQTTLIPASWGFLHVVQIATDSIGIAVDSTATNAPNGLSTADLVNIYDGTYTTWNQVPGNSGGSHDAIVPELPPSSSSVYKTFLADLKAANGGSFTLGSTVTVEQNDPSAITASASSADAIVPFSAGRLALWNAGYFHNPATKLGTGTAAALTPGIKLLTAASGDADSAASYSSLIKDYVIFRNSDESDGPWQPGGTENWVQTLFTGSDPFVKSTAGIADIEAAGSTPAYDDLGDVNS